MMFVAVNEKRISDPIVLEIDIELLREAKFIISDSNASSKDVNIGSSIEFIENNIHFELFDSKFFEQDENDKSFYQADLFP